MLEFLVKHGAPVNVRRSVWLLSLISLAQGGFDTAPEWYPKKLLELGADVNYRNIRKATALQIAAIKDYLIK